MNNKCGEYNNNDCGECDDIKLIENDCCDERKNINKNEKNITKDLEDLKNSKNVKSQKSLKIYKTTPAMSCIWDTVKNSCKIRCTVHTMKKK